jgi:hypothetical protein
LQGQVKSMAGDAKKVYVRVEARFSEDGAVHPTCVIWNDGSRYTVQSVLDARPGVSLLANGAGMRYTVRIGDCVTYLYQAGTRWFVEKKHP